MPKQIHSQATSFSLPSRLHLPGRGAQARRVTGVPILSPCPLAPGQLQHWRDLRCLQVREKASDHSVVSVPSLMGTGERAELGVFFRGWSAAFRRFGPHSISDQRPQSGGPGASLSGLESQRCLFELCHSGRLSSTLCARGSEEWQVMVPPLWGMKSTKVCPFLKQPGLLIHSN